MAAKLGGGAREAIDAGAGAVEFDELGVDLAALFLKVTLSMSSRPVSPTLPP
ncbi:hypothetical protein [Enhygromyxa salina]|uniref:hypothetical protein n=1 Tax=Enhygromyxa salina TaxID=215803 RepID=UPI0015E5A8D8|nr:hypothetical protein [Enhygromyxa salina]